jgi:hypothetical protein
MNKVIIIGVLISLFSCKSKSIIVQEKEKTAIVTPQTTPASAIENHYNNKSTFSTLYIKSSVHYEDEKQSQNVTAEIKIKKGEQILVSIRFLGITMAKALITPTTVSYYEKLNGSYFEGDFGTLSQWLGPDLDFNKIQNLVLGQPIDDLRIEKYKETLEESLYRLDAIPESNTKKTFFLDATNFLLQKQEVTQTSEERIFKVVYSNIKTYTAGNFPLNVLINTLQKDKKTEINLEYDTISFDEELTFPYSVPSGYKRILIN